MGKSRKGFAAHPENINRGGRPTRELSITEQLRRVLKSKSSIDAKVTRIERIAIALAEKAEQGDISAIKLVLQYVDGLPVQKVDLGNSEHDVKIGIEIVKREDADK